MNNGCRVPSLRGNCDTGHHNTVLIAVTVAEQRLMSEMQRLDESRQHEVSMWKVCESPCLHVCLCVLCLIQELLSHVPAPYQSRCAASEDVGAQLHADLRSVRELCDVQERTIAVLQAQVRAATSRERRYPRRVARSWPRYRCARLVGCGRHRGQW